MHHDRTTYADANDERCYHVNSTYFLNFFTRATPTDLRDALWPPTTMCDVGDGDVRSVPQVSGERRLFNETCGAAVRLRMASSLFGLSLYNCRSSTHVRLASKHRCYAIVGTAVFQATAASGFASVIRRLTERTSALSLSISLPSVLYYLSRSADGTATLFF